MAHVRIEQRNGRLATEVSVDQVSTREGPLAEGRAPWRSSAMAFAMARARRPRSAGPSGASRRRTPPEIFGQGQSRQRRR